MTNPILDIDKASIQKYLHHNAYHSIYGVDENSVDHLFCAALRHDDNRSVWLILK